MISDQVETRSAVLEDLDNVVEVFSIADQLHIRNLPQIFQPSADAREVKSYYASVISRPEGVILLAEIDGEVVGAIAADVYHAPDLAMFVPRSAVVINNLVVDPDCRRTGIGCALIEGIHEWARERDISTVELTVWEFNHEAIAFYEELGYKIARRRMWKELT